MNSSRHSEAAAEPRQLEAGTMWVRACRADTSRRSTTKAEARSAQAGSRRYGPDTVSQGRANGFSPRVVKPGSAGVSPASGDLPLPRNAPAGRQRSQVRFVGDKERGQLDRRLEYTLQLDPALSALA
jgi:hypothetical protein